MQTLNFGVERLDSRGLVNAATSFVLGVGVMLYSSRIALVIDLSIYLHVISFAIRDEVGKSCIVQMVQENITVERVQLPLKLGRSFS